MRCLYLLLARLPNEAAESFADHVSLENRRYEKKGKRRRFFSPTSPKSRKGGSGEEWRQFMGW